MPLRPRAGPARCLLPRPDPALRRSPRRERRQGLHPGALRRGPAARPGATIARAVIRTRRCNERSILADFSVLDAEGEVIATIREGRFQALRAKSGGDLAAYAITQRPELATEPTAIPMERRPSIAAISSRRRRPRGPRRGAARRRATCCSRAGRPPSPTASPPVCSAPARSRSRAGPGRDAPLARQRPLRPREQRPRRASTGPLDAPPGRLAAGARRDHALDRGATIPNSPPSWCSSPMSAPWWTGCSRAS